MKLRICMISSNFPILGRATDTGYLWPLAKNLRALGHEVVVLSKRSPLKKYQVVRDEVEVFYLWEGEEGSQSQFQPFEETVYEKFKALHQEKPFHIVHTLDRSARWVAKHKSALGIKVVCDVQATHIGQLLSILGFAEETVSSFLRTSYKVLTKYLTTYFGHDRELLRSSDGFIVNTPQQRTILERYYFYPEFKTHVVPYGLDLRHLTPKLDLSEVRHKFNLSEEAQVFLTASDMIEVQDTENILRAFQKVAIKKPKARLLILGEGPAFKKIEYMVLSLALGQRVLMPGSLSHESISELMSLATAFLNLGSRRTGLDSYLVEAMAQKKIIIGSEIGTLAEVIEDGVDGYLVRPADIEGLETLMLSILSDSGRMTEFGEKAFEKFITLFDPQAMVKALEDAYKSILRITP